MAIPVNRVLHVFTSFSPLGMLLCARFLSFYLNKGMVLDSIQWLLNMMLHIDEQLRDLVVQYGVYIYGILFAVIFNETGLVVFPFLPGDSLLFLAGALSADGLMNAWVLTFLLIFAAVLGNTVNYWIGSKIGHKAYEIDTPWFSHEHLHKTHSFYEKHGGKALVMARFLPVIRTFVPFVAGISEMSFFKFQKWNVLGAGLWVVLFVWGGYFFGNFSFTLLGYHIAIKDHLSTIALIGFAAAFVPVVAGLIWRLTAKKT